MLLGHPILYFPRGWSDTAARHPGLVVNQDGDTRVTVTYFTEQGQCRSAASVRLVRETGEVKMLPISTPFVMFSEEYDTLTVGHQMEVERAALAIAEG